MLIAYDGHSPQVDPTAYVQETARLIGDVTLGADSSVWFQVVVRGDVNRIRIGARTNLQDHVTVHVTTGRWPTVVGDDVSVAHGVILHGCTVDNGSLVGIGAIVLDGAVIGEGCLVAAGALVTPGTQVPAGQLVLGSPARVVRPLTDEERQHLARTARGYVERARRYRAQGIA
jgi:carbonic anhydrase/acetyltransferase-like protein (isoleucine patch superfamily)